MQSCALNPFDGDSIMLALFLVPAFLGLALILNTSDDNDDTDDIIIDETPPEEVQPIEIIATPDQDILEGTQTADRLIGNDLGNEILGEGGNDFIEGRGGNDAINGGDGNDTILSGDGDDFVTAGQGNDRVFLGDGDDEYLADDDLAELAGDDFVRGGDGRDFIADALGSNELRGDLGRDTLIAFDGLDETGNYAIEAEFNTVDTLFGGFGNDVLAGDGGDILEGFVGNDTFVVTDDEDTDLAAANIVDFSTEEDTLVILQLDGLSSSSEISLSATAEGVNVAYEGRPVALLEGLDAADIPDIRVSLINQTGFEALIA